VAGHRYYAFREFHWRNPQVYKLFTHFANQALMSGREYFGARMIGERIRWYTRVETTDADFKVNDHVWPYYARLLMLEDSRFRGFFSLRDRFFDADEAEMRTLLPLPPVDDR
jgi:hypothetical protein